MPVIIWLWFIKDTLGSSPLVYQGCTTRFISLSAVHYLNSIDFSMTKTTIQRYNLTRTQQRDFHDIEKYLCLDSPSKIDFSLRYTRSLYVNHRLCLRKSWQEHNCHNQFQSLKLNFHLHVILWFKCTYLANSPTLDLVILEVCWMHYSCPGHKHIGHTNHTIQLQWMRRKIGLAIRYFSEHQFHQQIENYHYHLLTYSKLV